MSQSETNDDIQSLTSQFNLCMAAGGSPQTSSSNQQQQQPQQTASSQQQQQQHHHQYQNQLSSMSTIQQQQQQNHRQQEKEQQQLPQPPTFIQGHGHYFTKKTFHKPTYCHHCADMLWGLIGQGYICEVCNFVVHERCMKTVVSCCSTVASSAIKNPMPHCWIDSHPKRKFCNVCRKKIEDNSNAIRCSVCEYCVHLECQEFSISDCRECATYVPEQKLINVFQQHHWREGNLQQNSANKCYWCKKSCYSAECLTGMRCEWCQLTVHASCLKQAPKDCSLGQLQSIMLPPYCVSIPRTDVPMETIIGVQSPYNPSMQNYANYSSISSTTSGIGSITNSTALNLMNMTTTTSASSTTSSSSASTATTNAPATSSSTSSSSISTGGGGGAAMASANSNVMIMMSSSGGGGSSNTVTSSSGQSLINQATIASKRDNLSPRSTSEDFCSIQSNQLSAYYQQQEDLLSYRDKDEEMFRVYDGNSSLKKRSFRLISVHRLATRDQLIAACLRAFYIHDDVNHYTLFDITDGLAGEREILAPQSNVNNTSSSSSSSNNNNNSTTAINNSIPTSSTTTTTSTTTSDNNSSNNNNNDQTNTSQQQQLPIVISIIQQNKQILKEFSKQQLMQQHPSFHHSGSYQQLFKIPALLLRYRPPDSQMGYIKVYPGKLNVIDLTYCNVMVTSDTSVDEIMFQALEKFKLPRTNDYLNRYRLVEVSLDKGSSVHERTMDNQECPWEILKNVARESVRQKEMTRFYLQQQDEVYCSSVAIFVGNLPTNLSEKRYESMLMEHLGKPYRFKSINPIYYEYGSCIITYDNADIAVKAFYMLRESTIKIGDEIRNLVVLLLPNIVPEMIPDGVRPLLVFVNVKSGGCQGLDLITSFRRLLNPYQVYDLENGGPLPGLYVFRKIRDYKILVSGGDGSVGWVLQCLDNVGQDSECQSPPCAIIPLGTGNDLARVLRWGSGYTGAEDPINFLKDIIDAEEVILDRWTVVFHSDEASKQEFPSALTMTPGAGSGAEDNAAIFVMNNYLGIGLDADLCLAFHNAREENPDKFNSRLHNKGVYVKQAIRKMVNRSSWNNLNKAVRLEVDGKPITLPHIEGIIILNILSWGSGANPWGPEVEDRFVKPTHYDGMLEVVGVTGIVHMGQIQSGLSRAIRIAQGGRIKIRINTEIPIQVDGEPWVQSACEVNIIRSALKATMLRKIKMKRRNTEPSINQELEKGNSNERFEERE